MAMSEPDDSKLGTPWIAGSVGSKKQEIAQSMKRTVQDLKIVNRSTGGEALLSASVGVKGITPSDSDSIYRLLDGAHKDLQSRRDSR